MKNVKVYLNVREKRNAENLL